MRRGIRRMSETIVVAAGFLAAASSSSAALVEISYLLTGTPIASYGEIGVTRLGDDHRTPITLTQGTPSPVSPAPVGIAGDARATAVLQSDGSVAYSLGLSGVTLTSDRASLTTTPVRVSITQDFAIEPWLTSSSSIAQLVSGVPGFVAPQQSATIYLASRFDQTPVTGIEASAGASGALLYASNASPASFNVAPVMRIRADYNIFLTSRGTRFTVQQITSSSSMTLIPAPGAAAALGLAGLVATRRRR